MLPATTKETELSSQLPEQRCRCFSLDEIRSATRRFNEAVLGRGGFGEVFKGSIDGPIPIVAIKRSKSMSKYFTPQFLTEVEMLSTLRHQNLVYFIGYCNEESEMALVYEYMPNGTLEDHLHKDGARLSWLQLLKICVGVARGLQYLHKRSETKQIIIHRDLKSSNILLDENFVAKISDFGLAKTGPINSSTHVSTDVKGTRGYMDPQYFATRCLRTKSDVYAFGVVLLEVITGLSAVHDGDHGDKRALAHWARDNIKQGKLNHIIDPRLSGQIVRKCGKDFALLACDCIDDNQEKRPKTDAVLSRLEKILSLQESPSSSKLSPSSSKLTDRIFSCFCFRPSNNFILVGENERKKSEKLNDPIIATRNVTGALCDENASELSNGSGSEGDRVSHDNYAIQQIHSLGSEAELSDNSGNVILPPKGNLMQFSYEVLREATKNFHPDKKIGEGSFGSVFKGWINEQSLEAAKASTGMIVAVVKKHDNQHRQSNPQWLDEVNCFALVDHPNLVKLIGYCADDDHTLLVYEYMEQGSLDHYFFRSRYTEPLAWNLRFQIALGAVKGLAYLHKPESKFMCHDFNATSILIDSKNNARISNFGVVKDVPLDASGQVIHTEGYADPECIKTGQFTTSSNIYSFGVVLLELLSGRRCIDRNGPEGEQILVEFAKDYLNRDFNEMENKIIDQHRDDYYVNRQI